MGVRLEDQLRSLLLALALGAAAGLLYDLLRPLRRRTGPLAGALLDIFACLLTGCGAFLYAMGAGNGRLGQWELAAMLLGFLLYLHVLSPPLLRLFTAGLNRVCRLPFPGGKRRKKFRDSAKNDFQNMRE